MHYRNHLSPPQFPTTWATSWGEDRFGLWMRFVYKEAELTFRWVPPGTFIIGAPANEKGRLSWEGFHEVTIEQGFWFSDTPVTQAFWQAASGNNPSNFKGEALPVETVSWDDVQQFIGTLNQLHPNFKVRLPFEAEWEYACRAGTSTAFSFGEAIDLSQANYRGVWQIKDYQNLDKEWGEGAQKKTSSVKYYPANAWGFYDMHGNVFEWCQDKWQEKLGTALKVFNLPEAIEKNAIQPEETSGESHEEQGLRVVRGGSWRSDGRDCRSAFRFRLTPGFRLSNVGFRLALGHVSSSTG